MGTYYIISNPSTIASSQVCHETVPEKRKTTTTTTSFPGLFRLSGGKPEEVEVHQYSCLDVTSILFIDTCLPSLFKSWLCGPVKWLTEETTNQFKSNAGSFLRVKNWSIEGGREREREGERGGEREREREKKKLSERSREPTNLSHTSVEGRIEPGQR